MHICGRRRNGVIHCTLHAALFSLSLSNAPARFKNGRRPTCVLFATFAARPTRRFVSQTPCSTLTLLSLLLLSTLCTLYSAFSLLSPLASLVCLQSAPAPALSCCLSTPTAAHWPPPHCSLSLSLTRPTLRPARPTGHTHTSSPPNGLPKSPIWSPSFTGETFPRGGNI